MRDGGSVDTMVDRLRLQVGRLDVTPDELIGRNQRSALFKTMFLAFREAGARDWRSNLTISLEHSGTQHRLQFHHIFPKALLRRLNRSSRDADDIANLAFISGGTNRAVSDKAPNVYLQNVGRPELDAFFSTQCIPPTEELMHAENYDAFLKARRDLISGRLNQFLRTEAHSSVPLGS